MKNSMWTRSIKALFFAVAVLFCFGLGQKITTAELANAVELEYQENIADAAAIVREKLEARAEVISVGVVYDKRTTEVANLIFDEALIHTGVPTQGDYLKFAYKDWEAQVSYEKDNDKYRIWILYLVEYNTTAEQETQMDAAVASVLDELNLYEADEYHKIRGIFDYIVDHTDFVFDSSMDENTTLRRTAYGALVKGGAYAEGYAHLFYRLALELGVDTRILAVPKGGYGHPWNIVKFGDYYYNLDAYNEDGFQGEGQYFLRDDYAFSNYVRAEEYDTEEFHAKYPMFVEEYGEEPEAPEEVAINEENFPDAAFRKILSEQYDEDVDGVLKEELTNITELMVHQSGIKDLTGIKYFTNLTYLNCVGNQLTGLDVSGLKSLQKVVCSNNQLKELNVSSCVNLEELICDRNQLTCLELEDCKYLRSLYCPNNALLGLDLSACHNLTSFQAYSNVREICPGEVISLSDLPDIDISKVIKWHGNWYDATTNEITFYTQDVIYTYDCGMGYEENFVLRANHAIDVNHDKVCDTCGVYMKESYVQIEDKTFPDDMFRKFILDELDAGDDGVLINELLWSTEIDVQEKGISDLSGIGCFSGMEVLKCNNNNLSEPGAIPNKLSSLDLRKNIRLRQVFCYNNADLTDLDVSGLAKLEYLSCSSCNISDLYFSGCTGLRELWCDYNPLDSLDVRELQALEALYCRRSLNSLDVRGLQKLTTLVCQGNPMLGISLTELDLTGVDNIELLYVGNNSLLAELDVTGKAKLRDLDIGGTAIDLNSIDKEVMKALEGLDCGDMNLVSLNLSGYTNLKNLSCTLNYLVNLDVSGCTSLVSLDYSNQAHAASDKLLGIERDMELSLDISGCTKLSYLDCSTSYTRSLELSECPELKTLDCSENYLRELDLSKCTKLEKLDCSDNQLRELDVAGLGSLWDLDCRWNELRYMDVSSCESIYMCLMSGNHRILCSTEDTLDVSDWPGFDVTKASEWRGAEFDVETGVLNNIAGKVSYEYDCGRGEIWDFSFEVRPHEDEDGDSFCDNCEEAMGTSGGEAGGEELADPIEAFVTRMYRVILKREPDAGSSTWIDGLKDGSMTGVRVADGFVLSEEMLNKDISNEEFVRILYRAFFGREADEGGLATWKNLLDAGCKKQYVFAGFANSVEFRNLCAEAGITQGRAVEYLADRQTGLSEQDYKVWCFVERMYTEVLKRTADESGVRTWVGVLQDGSYTGVKVADGFLMSEEFLAKDMTNEEYVQIMYRAFFNRDADPEGLATWTNALANGYTKQFVFAGFANSNEFGVLCEQAGIVKGTAEEQ